MKTILVHAVGVSCVVVVGVIGWCGSIAGAQAPESQGWWTVTNPGVVATPPPPDVPANGLLVEGGRDTASPVALAALVYDLPSGGTASSLTLKVVPNAGTTPNSTLQLCVLEKSDLQPEQGGPMSDAPAYTCGGNVTAAPSSDGATYRFSVPTLVNGPVLAVAILPTASTDRVVLAAPDSGSLDVATASSSSALALGGGATDSQGSLPGTFPVPLPPGGNGAAGRIAPNPGVHGQVGTGPSVAGRFVPELVRSGARAATASTVVLAALAALIGAVAWARAGDAAVRSAAESSEQGVGG